jgi:hypothetical protein
LCLSPSTSHFPLSTFHLLIMMSDAYCQVHINSTFRASWNGYSALKIIRDLTHTGLLTNWITLNKSYTLHCYKQRSIDALFQDISRQETNGSSPKYVIFYYSKDFVNHPPIIKYNNLLDYSSPRLKVKKVHYFSM